MKTIFLHIGSEKTATTTLQAFLTQNENLLLQQDFSYFCDDDKKYVKSNPIERSHTPIAGCLFSKLPGFVLPSEHHSEAVIFDTLHKDIIKKNGNVILSCEHFSSRLIDLHMVLRLHERLQIPNYKLKVIIYIRRQDEMAYSSYFTSVLSGYKHPFDLNQITPDNMYFNYLKIIELWSSVFGKENMIVRNYNQIISEDDIRDDFLKVVGVKKINNFKYGSKKNISLGSKQIEMLRLVNSFLPDYDYTDVNFYESGMKNRNVLLNYLSKIDSGTKSLNKSDRKIIMGRFAAINKEIENNYMAPDALADWLFIPEVGVVDNLPDVNDFAKLIADLLST